MFPYGVNGSLPDIGISARLCRFQENPGYYSGGGIKRYQFDGSTWSLAYTLNNGLDAGARYVMADFSGANPVVYAVTT